MKNSAFNSYQEIHMLVCELQKINSNSTFIDITWTEHSVLTTPRYRHSSAFLQDALYLLGDSLSSDSKTTEKLNIGAGQKVWTKSFDLQSDASKACTVQTSNEEILLIAGAKKKSDIKIFKYNVKTGDALQYNNLPPSQVWSVLKNCYNLCFMLFHKYPLFNVASIVGSEKFSTSGCT